MSSLTMIVLVRCGRKIAIRGEAELRGKTTTMASVATRLFSTSASSSSSPGGVAALCQRLDADLSAMRSAGTFKTETVMTSPQGPKVTVSAAEGGAPREVLNFCSNNYLGFSNHPRLVAAARKSLDEFGFGLSSVRFICGTQSPHEALEKRIAEFHGAEAAILYPSCFDANAGLFEAILTSEDAIVSDELNHASIIDGVRLCKATRYRFKHASVEDLKEKLKEARAAGARHVVVATDGVFSMDGEIAPLLEIKRACEEAGAVLFVDECHATGVLGKVSFFFAAFSGFFFLLLLFFFFLDTGDTKREICLSLDFSFAPPPPPAPLPPKIHTNKQIRFPPARHRRALRRARERVGHRQLDARQGPGRRHGRVHRGARLGRRDAAPEGQAVPLLQLRVPRGRGRVARGAGSAEGVGGGARGVAAEQHEEVPVRWTLFGFFLFHAFGRLCA